MPSAACRLVPVAMVAALAAVAVSAQDVHSSAPRGGAIRVGDAWSRATSPRAEVGAGFLTVINTGARPDRLIAASSPRAARVEIHTMRHQNGVMRMRPLPGGVVVPARGETRLAPGGHHLMLIGLKAPLRQGEQVPATLRFERAGTVRITLRVRAAGAAGGGQAEHRH